MTDFLQSSIKKLIECGKLTEKHCVTGVFKTQHGRRGRYYFEMFENRVYFYAKIYGCELPCKSYRVTRKTIVWDCLKDLYYC